MRLNTLPAELTQLIDDLDPCTLIPALEKGIEIEKMELAVNPGNENIKLSIRNARVLLSFLYCRKFGLS